LPVIRHITTSPFWSIHPSAEEKPSVLNVLDRA
jgi:hypothetical protein